MRKLLIAAMLLMAAKLKAQNNTVSNIIEGGRALVELVKVFRTPKNNLTTPAVANTVNKDSCSTRGLADVCYKNNLGKTISISLYKRNGNAYATMPLSLTIIPNIKECVYEIQTGIYKYKIEFEDDEDKKTIYAEGEIKLQACDKFYREIKKE